MNISINITLKVLLKVVFSKLILTNDVLTHINRKNIEKRNFLDNTELEA